ncbi:agmatine deiminase family protein [uncultured Abyssibacter sp.]|uniref:agmatine deiminase family protein n=1 Tax=uncultured Abyssibacter sp. TaxID=2320202 RepID=UPI0032B124C1
MHWPAEFAPQASVQLTWPHAGTDWGDDFTTVEPVFQALARLITARAELIVAAADPDHVHQALELAGVSLDKAQVFECPTDDVWARDHAPITVVDGDRALLLDFRFDGWGGKFDASQDNVISRRLHDAGAFGHTDLHGIDWTLEGGGIESDGAGTLLATRACLLDPRRNPGVTQAGLEASLHEWLGVTRVLWLEHGHLEGDDTDSHIDTLARVANPNVITFQACDNRLDSHHDGLKAMQRELSAFRTPAGHPYELVPLPLPEPQIGDDGRRLPAGYANFLILNDAVLVPVYRTHADDIALRRLDDAFPSHRIEPVDCRALITQNGSLHCVTMNYPDIGATP